MILPGKHLSRDRALLTVGARLLTHLSRPKTVSSLWEEISRSSNDDNGRESGLRYEAYVLTLDLLFMMDAIELTQGFLRRKMP